MTFFQEVNKKVDTDSLYENKANGLGLNGEIEVASLPDTNKGFIIPRANQRVSNNSVSLSESEMREIIGDFESKKEPEYLDQVMDWWSNSFTESSKAAAEKRKSIRNPTFKGQTIDAIGATALGTMDEGERATNVAREFAKANKLDDRYEDTLRHVLMGGLIAPKKKFGAALKSLDFEDLGKQLSSGIMNRRKTDNLNKFDLIGKFVDLFAREGRVERTQEPLNESSIDIENNVFGRLLREKLRREGHTDPEHFEEAARMAVYGMANQEINEYSMVEGALKSSIKGIGKAGDILKIGPTLSKVPE
jgi:hypothetical protein|tara:strand:+ start:487 stop:1401 length:915 start_codon:yes stop_codon:yes gene_type:complete